MAKAIGMVAKEIGMEAKAKVTNLGKEREMVVVAKEMGMVARGRGRVHSGDGARGWGWGLPAAPLAVPGQIRNLQVHPIGGVISVLHPRKELFKGVPFQCKSCPVQVTRPNQSR